MNRITLYFSLLLSLSCGIAHAGQTELLAAYEALEDHINGVSTLTTAEINTQASVVSSNKGNAGDNATMITASLGLVETYETEVGYLFNTGEFSRTDTSNQTKALRIAMFNVYQAVIDDVYNAWNLSNHGALLDGYKFESADYFPGAVAAPSDPNAVYSVQINASQVEAWGYEVQFQYESARRPTGAYLAPGSIATVTVPAALVGKGYEIRVGAHVADLTNRPNNYKRLNRVTNTYPINSTTTEIASPLGGGIYIEVPYGEDEGLVTVEFQNTVRAPFYSNSSARQTTLTEWQNTERSHPGAWADFETDKFMLTVPTDWIYNYSDPVTLMNNWDLAMDACSDMQGMPRIRPKTVLYCIVDVTFDANVYSPGYPQSNDNYTPTSSSGGNKSHDYLNGPKFANHVHLHEFGHASYINKFNGEVEALVNLFYVPVHNRFFNVPLEESFGRSLNTNSGSSMSRKHAAINWASTSLFRGGNAMTATQMKYQHRGYAKYVEIAALFGWDALGDFWKSVAVDAENGITYSRNSDPADSRIIRMSRAANANLLPLIHFWGVHPNNASSIQSTLDSEGIPRSAAIYDRLKYYQSVIPMTTAEWQAHDNAVGNLISVNEQDQYNTWRTTWTAALGQECVDAIQDIIDTYFPEGRPVASLPHFEDFEDGIGDWAQATDDNFEWRRHSGETFSTAAGPEAASSGDYYMYAEGHDAPGSNKTASFQCTFDFSSLSDTTLSFDYHMYGSYIDFLAVDIYDGTTWTENVWVKNGQQHTGSSEAWSSATVDLTSFTGNSEVTIRFRTANTQWKSADPAIDNIRIELGPLPLPYYESFESGMGAWQQVVESANPDVFNFDWTHHSGSTVTAATGPSAASDGSSYLYIEPHDYYDGHNKVASIDCVFDMSTVSAPDLSFDYHMYGVNVDYLAVDVHDGTTWTTDVWKLTKAERNEDAWANAKIDMSAYAGNSAVTIRFRAKQGYWHVSDIAIDNIILEELQILPYAEDFESGPGAWVQSTDDDYDWTHHTGGTESSAAGPDGASSGDYYMYAEGHHGQGSYKTSSLQCAFDFSLVQTTILTFDFHMYGGYIDYLAVDIHDGTSWTEDVWVRNGRQHLSSDAPWSSGAVDLTSYTGNDAVKVRFRTANTLWNSADPAIDNIRIFSPVVGPLVAHWSMDDSAGTMVTDEQANGFDARLSGALWVPGIVGNALEFDGSSSTVTLPESAFITISDEITLSMWVYGGVDQPRQDSVFYAVNAAGERMLNVHLPWSDGNVYWDAGPGSTYDRMSKLASTDQYQGQWNHWVFTKNASTGDMAIYLNGALWDSATSMTYSMSGITEARLGSRVGDKYYSGTIDDVRIYNVSFDATEVSDLFSSYTTANGVQFGWLMSHGIDPSEAGAQEDTDADTLSNEVEWLLGLNPSVFSSPYQTMTTGESAFQLDYTRRKSTGFSIYAEWSPDLEPDSWDTTGLTEEVIGDDGEIETVTVTVPYAVDQDQKFVRIIVE